MQTARQTNIKTNKQTNKRITYTQKQIQTNKVNANKKQIETLTAHHRKLLSALLCGHRRFPGKLASFIMAKTLIVSKKLRTAFSI